MKKLIQLFLTTILLFSSALIYAQSTTVTGNYPNGDYPSIVITDAPGDSCNGAGLEQHDGPIHGNGYTAFTDSVRMVIKFRPPAYPWNYTNVCCAFTRTAAGPTSMLYDIVVYDTLGAGGLPGNLLQVITGQTVSGINIYPQYTWNSKFVSIPVYSGVIYIGYRYKNSLSQAFYCTVDEQAATTLWPGYYATNTTFPAVWQTIQSVAGFTAYKCMAIRTQGFLNYINLCEQFTSTTFPPSGWTEIYTGTNYWSRVTQSGFGIGTGSAKYDNWNAPLGTSQELITPTFYPTYSGSFLSFDVAFQSFGAPDSLILLSSTNNGTTYITLQRLGNSQLFSTSGNPSPFVPTPTQWKKLAYNLPILTNKIKIIGKSGFGDNLYVDSICVYYPEGIKNNNYQIPNLYSLSQNYPNPFNPTTVISYGIPAAGNVKLVVYDILGREVKTLVDEFKQAGNYNINFDGLALASGVYFYTLTAQPSDRPTGYTETKKMLLIK